MRRALRIPWENNAKKTAYRSSGAQHKETYCWSKPRAVGMPRHSRRVPRPHGRITASLRSRGDHSKARPIPSELDVTTTRAPPRPGQRLAPSSRRDGEGGAGSGSQPRPVSEVVRVPGAKIAEESDGPPIAPNRDAARSPVAAVRMCMAEIRWEIGTRARRRW